LATSRLDSRRAMGRPHQQQRSHVRCYTIILEDDYYLHAEEKPMPRTFLSYPFKRQQRRCYGQQRICGLAIPFGWDLLQYAEFSRAIPSRPGRLLCQYGPRGHFTGITVSAGKREVLTYWLMTSCMQLVQWKRVALEEQGTTCIRQSWPQLNASRL